MLMAEFERERAARGRACIRGSRSRRARAHRVGTTWLSRTSRSWVQKRLSLEHRDLGARKWVAGKGEWEISRRHNAGGRRAYRGDGVHDSHGRRDHALRTVVGVVSKGEFTLEARVTVDE